MRFNLRSVIGGWRGATTVVDSARHAALLWIAVAVAATALEFAMLSLVLEQREGMALVRS